MEINSNQWGLFCFISNGWPAVFRSIRMGVSLCAYIYVFYIKIKMKCKRKALIINSKEKLRKTTPNTYYTHCLVHIYMNTYYIKRKIIILFNEIYVNLKKETKTNKDRWNRCQVHLLSIALILFSFAIYLSYGIRQSIYIYFCFTQIINMHWSIIFN